MLPRSAVEGGVEDGEYLGAAMRLTAELSRYAITQVKTDTEDAPSVAVSWNLKRQEYVSLKEKSYMNRP